MHATISSGAWKDDMNAHIVLSRTHHSAASEVLTPTSTYCKIRICMFYLSKFHTKQDFVFKYIPCNFINLQFANKIFKSWEFYHWQSFAANKQNVHIVSSPAGRMGSHHSAGHTPIYVLSENQKGNKCTSWEPWDCLNILRFCPNCLFTGVASAWMKMWHTSIYLISGLSNCFDQLIKYTIELFYIFDIH